MQNFRTQKISKLTPRDSVPAYVLTPGVALHSRCRTKDEEFSYGRYAAQIDPAVLEAQRADARAVHVACGPRDVVFFSNVLMHRGGDNNSGETTRSRGGHVGVTWGSASRNGSRESPGSRPLSEQPEPFPPLPNNFAPMAQSICQTLLTRSTLESHRWR